MSPKPLSWLALLIPVAFATCSAQSQDLPRWIAEEFEAAGPVLLGSTRTPTVPLNLGLDSKAPPAVQSLDEWRQAKRQLDLSPEANPRMLDGWRPRSQSLAGQLQAETGKPSKPIAGLLSVPTLCRELLIWMSDRYLVWVFLLKATVIMCFTKRR